DQKGLADEYRTNRFLTDYGLAPTLGFPQLRQTLPGQSKNTDIFLHGSVPVHGICSINLSREFTRHRDLPPRQSAETVSHGYSIPRLTKHISRRQRKPRLANLRRLCPNSYLDCQRAVCQGRLRPHSGSRGLCTRLNHHRLVPVPISLGTI